MTAIDEIALSSSALSVVVVHDGGMPRLASVGPILANHDAERSRFPVAPASLDVEVPIGIVAEESVGFAGRPGLIGCRRDGTAWSPRFVMRGVRHDTSAATFELSDDVADLALTIELSVDTSLTVALHLDNTGDTPYLLQSLAPSIPVPDHATDLITFSGRWCREFHLDRRAFESTTSIENRSGRSSHEHPPALFALEGSSTEVHGEVWGAQLAWSGNHELVAERLPDGRRHLRLGELLAPGEVVLEPGERYTSPDVVVVWSDRGIGAASQRFHEHVRSRSPSVGPRPVLLNTWEAVYFDHDLDTLRRLADVAASVGVERFVLDDGWFGGRRTDQAGLGDWWVSPDVWPDGLAPIVEHVRASGMQFGLWVEPEMVNPDSELYRKHPEWTLTTAGYEPVLARSQLVLDVGRREVRDFLFEAIDPLVAEHGIDYLKWDMNRPIVQGSHHGRAGTHRHVAGVYELMDRLRAAHPRLEIESCASGGGRIDLGVLRRTDRVWTSDCNDALERQHIQRGCSMLFPPEVMGAHVGPDRAHTTGRRHDLAFRAATALFGHLGIEWNLLEASDEELRVIGATVALHRRLRPLLHGGRTVRVEHPDPAALVHGVVSADARHGVFAYVQLEPSVVSVPSAMRLRGLDPVRPYRVDVLTDLGVPRLRASRPPRWLTDGDVVTGGELITRGLPLPVVRPESAILIELRELEW